MSTRRIRLLGSSFAAAAALAVLMPFAGASAANYYSYSSHTCNNVSGCRNDTFNAVPAGKTLTVTRVTCTIKTSESAILQSVKLGQWASGYSFFAGPFIAPMQKLGSDANNIYYMGSGDVLYTINAGYKPMINVATIKASAVISTDCNVAGTLTP